ncbi:Transcription factor BYE1 [Elsinoe australis]|uniref:Transcription factor BYE1 n=1 Tax=Elsinoe australis TaxID=40998 RepID=A0A2P7YQ66_9PEZI|nr:Transcription factor BYE1 [Elsinoe australis]
MAAVRDHADDAGSISSVPSSTIGTDVDEDEMPQTVTAPVNSDAGASAKDREAQAETSRSRQRIEQSRPQQAPAQDPPEQSTSHQPAAVQDTVLDPDDVPPPSYAEAVQRQNRPDDAVRHAWRQGISQGSLDMDSFSRLVSPTSESQTSQLRRSSGTARHNQAQSQPPHAQHPPIDEYTPVASQADATTNPHYGSTPFAHRDEPERIADEEAGPLNDSSSDSDHGRWGRRWWRRKREDWYGRPRRGAGRGGGRSDQRHPGRRPAGPPGRRPHDPPRWSEDYEKRRRRRLKKLLFWLLIIVGFVTVVNFLIEAIRSTWTGDNGGTGTIPSQPTQPTQPTDPGKINPGKPAQHRQSVCQAAQWTSYFTYSYNKVEDLHIKEALTEYDVGGMMRVIAAPEDQEEMIEASVAFAVAPSYSVNKVHFTSELSGLSVDEPVIKPDPNERHDVPCVDVDIVLSVKPDAEITNLRLETWHLSIVIEKDVFGNSTHPGLHVRNSTALLTIGGRVTAEPLSSRTTIIRTKSGSVNGHYSLYDLLDIETASGSVTVGVDPREADKDDPTHPAKLRVSTSSGTVRVDTSLIGSLPNRIYQTFVDTNSASISGSYLLGSEAKFSSHSGTTDVKLLPYIFSSSSSPGLRQPDPPTAPDSPTPPTPPSAPSAPQAPSPLSKLGTFDGLRGLPELPDLPELPEIPDIPEIPEIPKIPAIPKIPDPPAYPALPNEPSDDHQNDSRFPHENAFSQTLITSTSSATTRVKILSPYSSGDQEFLLSTSHSTNSGTMHLSYPDAWSGNIEAETMSGHLHVKGSRVVRTGGSWNWGDWRSRYGEKGKWQRHDKKGNVGPSKIEAGSMSSTVEIIFDEF